VAQFARPDGNVTQTSFTGGFAEIDEATPSDADFAYGANNTAAELEVSLGDVTDPQSGAGHTFRYRIAKTDDGVVDGGGNAVTVTVRLMQGTTEIAADSAQTATGTWTQYELTLTSGQADAITNYADLRLEFVTSASGGSPANRRGGAVSWAELEVPDAPSGDRRTIVTWAELELPNAPRRTIVTWAEFEVPTAPRRAIVTWAELELPTAPRRTIVTWAELEVPDAPTTDRRTIVTWAELEIPTAPRRAIVTWAELELPGAPRRAIVTWAELQLPDVGGGGAVIFRYTMRRMDSY
jgi:hypothetical protein